MNGNTGARRITVLALSAAATVTLVAGCGEECAIAGGSTAELAAQRAVRAKLM